eukprot:Skav236661  [mRNA]  locus=scaffold3354:85803:95093:+ [translate_table: standard]
MGAHLAGPRAAEAAPRDGAVADTAPRWLQTVRSAVTLPPVEVVERALVDTGSSDCELREGLLKHLPPLPVVARGDRLGRLPTVAEGVIYETAVIGLAALSALDLVVTCGQRTVVDAASNS